MNTATRIKDKIHTALSPVHLEVIDESHRHNVPSGAESHFKLIIVTEHFSDLALLARHRSVNKLLADELQSGVHALALHTHTPEEWSRKNATVAPSPPCLGGDKNRG
ncbi:MAG: BolA/IbaG family iron-sulfur metabolism protein [Pseudomonadota bacterium]